MSWTAMTEQRELPPALWGWRGDPGTRAPSWRDEPTTRPPRPPGGFWTVVTVVLPLGNVVAESVVLHASRTGEAFFAALTAMLVAELVALHRWLLRAGVRPARWLAVAGFLILAETGVVLFLALVAIFAAVGGD
jgi:hypothetical protein